MVRFWFSFFYGRKNQANRSVYEYWLTFLSDLNTHEKNYTKYECFSLFTTYVYTMNILFAFWVVVYCHHEIFHTLKKIAFNFAHTQARTHTHSLHTHIIPSLYVYYYDVCNKLVIASKLLHKWSTHFMVERFECSVVLKSSVFFVCRFVAVVIMCSC